MTDEGLAVVRRAFESLVAGMQSGDPGVILREPWDPAVEYAEDERWPGSSEYRGAEAVARRFMEYGEVIGEVTATLEDVRDAGERARVTLTVSGTAGTSGLPMEHTWTYLATERGGRVVRFEAYLDPADARP